MKLNDIITEASIFDEKELLNTKWTSPQELQKWLSANGFKKLGSGVFSAVYGKPDHNRVVKISKRGDECWLKFANWLMAQTKNPYLPHVPWLKQYKGTRNGKTETFFVTIIEKLDPFTTDVIKNIKDPVVIAALLLKGDFWANEKKVLQKRLVELGYETPKEQKELLMDNNNHKFINSLRMVSKRGGKSCFGDLHSGNIMFRPSNNSVVITDPLAGEWTA